jgi:hypothetical protein
MIGLYREEESDLKGFRKQGVLETGIYSENTEETRDIDLEEIHELRGNLKGVRKQRSHTEQSLTSQEMTVKRGEEEMDLKERNFRGQERGL